MSLPLAPNVPIPTALYDHGACVGADTALFFPPIDKETPHAARMRVKAAKKICASCIVRVQCGEYATAAREPGIWGGMDEAARRQLRRSRAARAGRYGR